MSVYFTRNLIYDGESTWLEGLILVSVYFMFGIGFLYHPATDPPKSFGVKSPDGRLIAYAKGMDGSVQGLPRIHRVGGRAEDDRNGRLSN